MKKIPLIFLSLMLMLLGCQDTKQDAGAQPVATMSAQAELAPLSTSPSPQSTPQPVPSEENLFIPAVTEAPTPEPTQEPTAEPTVEPTDTPEPVERYVAADGAIRADGVIFEVNTATRRTTKITRVRF